MFRYCSVTALLPILLFYPAVLLSQVSPATALPEEVEFGSVDDSLLHYRSSHDYPFEYLLKKGDISFVDSGGSITAILDYLVRIKIYSEDPLEQAEAALVGIPFYFDGGIEEITGVEAITHQPNGEEAWLDTGEIRTVDLNSRYKILEFLMPDVRQGSVLEYRYRLNRRYIEELPDFYFAHRVPTALAHVTLHNTGYMRYETVSENSDFDLEFLEERIDTSSLPRIFTIRRPEPILIQHWFARDIPAVEAPAYISAMDDLRSKLKFQMSEFGTPRQPLQNSWDYVAAQIRRGDHNPFVMSESLMDEIRKTGEFPAESFGDSTAIMDSVFHYVNRRVTSSGEKSVFPGGELHNVLDGEPADQASINTVLLAMLRSAGLKAFPVYLSGRSGGKINMEFPSLFQFNQMLVAVEIGRETILMDASFPYSRPDLIPVDAYNETGMLFRSDGYRWIDIRPTHSVFDLDLDIAGELSDEGRLTGRIRAETGGYPAQQIKSDLAEGKPARQVITEVFFDAYGDIGIEYAEIREIGERGYSLSIEAGFSIPHYAVSFREGLQFNPMVVGYLQQNPFEESSRTAPVTLDAPEKLRINYRLSLPESYRIDEMHESRMTRTRGAHLNEEYDVKSGEIHYEFFIDIERRDFAVDEYSQLKNLYDRWVFLSNDEWYIER